MSTDHESGDGIQDTEGGDSGEDVGEGMTNHPRGNGDLDEQALEAGRDRLDQAGAGH